MRVVLHVGDGENGAELLKLGQKRGDFLLVHREGRVAVVAPGPVAVKGEGLAVVVPGQGLHGVGVDLQNHLSTGFDLLLVLFHPEHRHGGSAQD